MKFLPVAFLAVVPFFLAGCSQWSSMTAPQIESKKFAQITYKLSGEIGKSMFPPKDKKPSAVISLNLNIHNGSKSDFKAKIPSAKEVVVSISQNGKKFWENNMAFAPAEQEIIIEAGKSKDIPIKGTIEDATDLQMGDADVTATYIPTGDVVTNKVPVIITW